MPALHRLAASFAPRLAALGFLAAALAACAATPAPDTVPTVTFTHLAPVRLDAAQVEFVDAYRPTMAPPNVEHQLRQPPATAMRDWVRARIAAVGATGVVRVTVYEASIIAVALPTRQGVGGLLFDEQDTRYEAALEVSIDYTGRGVGQSQARTRVFRTRTVAESITVNQRNQVYYELLRGLMEDLDRQLIAATRQYLGAVVLP